jgi:hypothetical protein
MNSNKVLFFLLFMYHIEYCLHIPTAHINNIEGYINSQIIDKQNSLTWLKCSLNEWDNWTEFLKRHEQKLSVTQLNGYTKTTRYLSTYGYIWLLKLDFKDVDFFKDVYNLSIVFDLMDIIYANSHKGHELNHIIESKIQKIQNVSDKIGMISTFIKNPTFMLFIIDSMKDITRYDDFEKLYLLGQIIKIEKTRNEILYPFNQNLDTVSQLFNYIYKNDSETFLNFFEQIAVYNYDKIYINDVIFYNDNKNSYQFLTNLLQILIKIADVNDISINDIDYTYFYNKNSPFFNENRSSMSNINYNFDNKLSCKSRLYLLIYY